MGAVLSRVMAGIVLGYAVVVGVLFLLQRRLMYFPDVSSPGPVSQAFPGASDLLSTTQDGLPLLHWYYPPKDGNKPVVVLFHGNAGNRAGRVFKAQALAAAGLGVLLVEYRGYGGNPGKPSEEGLYADGRSALLALASRGIGPERMVFYGESIGSGVATQMAVEVTPAALVLEAPLTSSAAVARGQYPLVGTQWLLMDKYDNLAKMPFVDAPVMIVHGEDDRVIPVHQGRTLLGAAKGARKGLFVPGAGHNNLYAFGVDRAVISFIALNMGLQHGQEALYLEEEEP
ncbi:MAG: hypothetical protein A2018_03035 [Alphaproteobacteria bacterium GWF2_58_20]|nr:MAG: hypothetical protein A2018_03035 [Alphaproteobacteria bacterium GWF2_58_20]